MLRGFHFSMSAYTIFAVGIGAAFGAWLRWAFSAWLNPALPMLPLGTLASNLIGGYFVGVAIALFGQYEASNELKLFVVTGLLGGLTTFSTFSAEAVTLLERGQYAWTALLMISHLAGSLVLTMLGIATIRWFNT